MKLYVIVRKDMSMSQIAVQAGHAVAEYCIASDGEWKNGTLVYLGVDGKLELEEWYNKFFQTAYPFYEEYYNDEMTAFAVYGTEEVQAAVKKLKLI